MKKLLLCAAAALVAMSINAQNNCFDIFISEYVEGSNNNKAIELYNPTPNPIVLDGLYSMGRDRDGAGNPMLLPITGVIMPHDVRVFALDKRDPAGTGTEVPLDADLLAVADTFLNPVYVQSNSPMYFNGDDAFVLVKNGNQILDIIGKIGEDPGGGWWVPGDPATRWWTADNTMIRKQNILTGVSTNPDVFDPSAEWDSLPSDTFTELGEHLCDCVNINPNSVNDLTTATFSIFPNPILEGAFTVKGSTYMEAITLFAADGRLIDQRNLMGVTYANITLPQAEAGVYFIEVIYSDGKKSIQKIFAR
jgi:predicted extracellular nuclease